MEALKSLVLRAQHGNLDAYATLVRRFQAMTIGYAQNCLGDRFLAEDAAQEAFIQVYFDLPRLRNPAAFSGWLRKIVFKHCNRITRRKGFAADPLDTLPDSASTVPQPDEVAEHRETRDRVRQAIDTLPESERTVTSLFYFDGYPQADIGSLPGATPTKPGTVSLPLFGVQPVVLNPETGAVLKDNNVEGHLAYAASWPGQIRTLYKDHDRFEQDYFKPYPGYYFTGDTCRRDGDGYYWILGKVTS